MIKVSWWMIILRPLLTLTGALLPKSGQDINVKVHMRSNPCNHSVHFERTFYYPKRIIQRSSTWTPYKESQVIEYMKFGFGWKMNYHYENDTVHLYHDSYVWSFRQYMITLPLHLLLGTPYAHEKAIDNNHLHFHLELNHPLFGQLFNFDAQFKLKQDSHE